MRTSYLLVGGPGHGEFVTLASPTPFLRYHPKVIVNVRTADTPPPMDGSLYPPLHLYERVPVDKPAPHGPAYEYRYVTEEEAARSSD